VVVLVTPDPYLNVGQVYEHFGQVDDDEVLAYLERRPGPINTPR
jgi:predicted phosphoribosyltransferase